MTATSVGVVGLPPPLHPLGATATAVALVLLGLLLLVVLVVTVVVAAVVAVAVAVAVGNMVLVALLAGLSAASARRAWV